MKKEQPVIPVKSERHGPDGTIAKNHRRLRAEREAKLAAKPRYTPAAKAVFGL